MPPNQVATGEEPMGKGDMRTKKGKRYRGTFGKSRPKHPKKDRPVAKATPRKST